MAEIRLNLAGDTDWRSAARNRQSSNANHGEPSDKETIREFRHNELVVADGIEYWFEPDRGAACLNALNLPRGQVGSFGVQNSVVNFYDYHRSVGSKDSKSQFLKVFNTVSTDSTVDGFHTIYWKNCCTNSFDAVRGGLYDYLETYVWSQKCSEIVTLIDSYVQTTSISQLEASLRDIIIGKEYFNNLFYLTSLAVADSLLSPELINSMLNSIPDKSSVYANHSRPQNALITQFDEAQRHVFRTSLQNNQFERDYYLRPERHWQCSPDDLRLRILPLILFISNWSLVLGAYLTVANFGSLAFTIGE